MESYKRGSHTVWDCKYHMVWVAKYRFRLTKSENKVGAETLACLFKIVELDTERHDGLIAVNDVEKLAGHVWTMARPAVIRHGAPRGHQLQVTRAEGAIARSRLAQSRASLLNW